MGDPNFGFSSYGEQPAAQGGGGYGTSMHQRKNSWEAMDVSPGPGQAGEAQGYGQPQQYGQPQYGQQQYSQQPMQPMQQPMQPMQPMQQPPAQPQQQGGAGGFGGFDGAAGQQMANMGMAMGQQFMNQHQEAANQAMERFGLGSDTLRQYFNVDGSYVWARFKLMAFPFLKNKDWRRRSAMPTQGGADQYGQVQTPAAGGGLLSPREDENAPDLYIPAMAFVTYVLVAGFTMGVSATDLKQFSPEMLGRTGSFGVVLWLLEVLVVKFGIYILHNVTIAIWDAVAYAGYKYVGVVASLMAYLVAGRMAYYAVVLYMGATVGYMVFKSYGELLHQDHMEHGTPDAEGKKLLLMLVGALQIVLTFFLGAIQ